MAFLSHGGRVRGALRPWGDGASDLCSTSSWIDALLDVRQVLDGSTSDAVDRSPEDDPLDNAIFGADVRKPWRQLRKVTITGLAWR